MRTHEEEIQIAECIIQEARSYVEHAESPDMVNLDDYCDEIDKLNLEKEDKELYKSRLDFILYTDEI